MNVDPDGDNATAKPAEPRRRSIGIASVAVIVAVIALAVSAWGAWRLQRMDRADAAARSQDAAALVSLEGRLAASERQVQAGGHRLGTLDAGLDELRVTVQGLDRRTANLEGAYSNLSGQQQSGRDTLLLNDAEMLLRTGQQRYELFHDSVGALKAYSQAIEVLAQVQNPAYAPVRAGVATERDALTAAAPPSRQAALDTLSSLRGKVPALPLAIPRDTNASGPASKPGFWSRVFGSLRGIVKVSRDNDTGAPLADTRFARQLLALDLAQAQESLLALDLAAYHAALQRADATLAAQFDTADAGVQDARNQLAALLAQRASGPPPRLGGALAQLESLRASQPVVVPPPAPASGGTAP